MESRIESKSNGNREGSLEDMKNKSGTVLVQVQVFFLGVVVQQKQNF